MEARAGCKQAKPRLGRREEQAQNPRLPQSVHQADSRKQRSPQSSLADASSLNPSAFSALATPTCRSWEEAKAERRGRVRPSLIHCLTLYTSLVPLAFTLLPRQYSRLLSSVLEQAKSPRQRGGPQWSQMHGGQGLGDRDPQCVW